MFRTRAGMKRFAIAGILLCMSWANVARGGAPGYAKCENDNSIYEPIPALERLAANDPSFGFFFDNIDKKIKVTVTKETYGEAPNQSYRYWFFCKRLDMKHGKEVYYVASRKDILEASDDLLVLTEFNWFYTEQYRLYCMLDDEGRLNSLEHRIKKVGGQERLDWACSFDEDSLEPIDIPPIEDPFLNEIYLYESVSSAEKLIENPPCLGIISNDASRRMKVSVECTHRPGELGLTRHQYEIIFKEVDGSIDDSYLLWETFNLQEETDQEIVIRRGLPIMDFFNHHWKTCRLRFNERGELVSARATRHKEPAPCGTVTSKTLWSATFASPKIKLEKAHFKTLYSR